MNHSSPRGPQESRYTLQGYPRKVWEVLIQGFFNGHERYTILNYTSGVYTGRPIILGSGYQGIVVKALDRGRNNEVVAIKVLKRVFLEMSEKARREVVNHAVLSHTNIAQFYRAFVSRKLLCIEMEYVDGKTMYEELRTYCQRNGCGFREDIARFFFWQLMYAVKYCHSKGVWIRDLKLQNLLVEGHWNLKICDMGNSKAITSATFPKSRTGTPLYLCPDVLMVDQVVGGYDAAKVDVWCCGIILWCMLTGIGQGPFFRQGDEDYLNREIILYSQIVNRVMYEDYHFFKKEWVGFSSLTKWGGFSESAEQLLRLMFVKDPNNRASVEQIIEHPWFTQGMTKQQHTKFMTKCTRTCAKEQSDQEILDVLEKAMQREEPTEMPLDNFDSADFE